MAQVIIAILAIGILLVVILEGRPRVTSIEDFVRHSKFVGFQCHKEGRDITIKTLWRMYHNSTMLLELAGSCETWGDEELELLLAEIRSEAQFVRMYAMRSAMRLATKSAFPYAKGAVRHYCELGESASVFCLIESPEWIDALEAVF